jgi:hypothetical protein
MLYQMVQSDAGAKRAALPMLNDAERFCDVVRYLFAYDQRTCRDGAQLPPEAARDLSWVLDHLDAVKVGKADASRGPNDEQMHDP